MKVTIKTRFTDAVKFEGEYESTKHACESNKANLSSADLSGADLYGADGEKIAAIYSVLQIGPIGSRKDYTTAIATDKGIYINAGCFFGTLKEFKDKVKATHESGRFAAEYKAAIAMINAIFKAREATNA